MLKFIRDCTAAPYFSNLVWFIGNHVIDIDNCLGNSKMESVYFYFVALYSLPVNLL